LPATSPPPNPGYWDTRSARVLSAGTTPIFNQSVDLRIRPALAPYTVGAIPPPPPSVFDNVADSLYAQEHDFIAAHRADGILADLLSLALQVGWRAGWKAGRERGILAGKEDGRREGVTEGRRVALQEARPPSVLREFNNAEIQTDAAAVIIPPQDPSPPLLVAPEPVVPPIVPIPRDFTALQTGSANPFGTLQRRLARSRRPHPHARKHMIPITTHPIITRRHPFGISNGKPLTTTPISSPPHRRIHRVVDWDCDPLLSDLSRALGALGWIRRVG